MNHDDRLKRADEAKRILNEPALKNAFTDIREGLVRNIESCGWNQPIQQNNIMLSLQLLKSLQKLIEAHITDGKVAQSEIEKMNNPKIKRVV